MKFQSVSSTDWIAMYVNTTPIPKYKEAINSGDVRIVRLASY
ncbi:hypothetical protein [Aquibacillus kalidii]|nr:hypothetical protein [Aquibacillus kalidii]